MSDRVKYRGVQDYILGIEDNGDFWDKSYWGTLKEAIQEKKRLIQLDQSYTNELIIVHRTLMPIKEEEYGK